MRLKGWDMREQIEVCQALSTRRPQLNTRL